MCRFFLGVSCKMHVTNSTGSRKTLHQSWWHSWTQTVERRGWGAFGNTNPSTAEGSACCGMAVICLLMLKADFGRKLHWDEWYKMEYITIIRQIMSNTVYSNMCEEKIWGKNLLWNLATESTVPAATLLVVYHSDHHQRGAGPRRGQRGARRCQPQPHWKLWDDIQWWQFLLICGSGDGSLHWYLSSSHKLVLEFSQISSWERCPWCVRKVFLCDSSDYSFLLDDHHRRCHWDMNGCKTQEAMSAGSSGKKLIPC